LILGNEYEEVPYANPHDPTANDEHGNVDRASGDACCNGAEHAARHDGDETAVFVICVSRDKAAPLFDQASVTCTKEENHGDPHESAD